MSAATASEAADLVKRLAGATPRPLVIVTGSGLRGLADIMEVERQIPSDEIPGMPQPTVQGHRPMLILGRIGALPTLLFAGRVHFYEGLDFPKIVFGIRMAAQLGARYVLMTNAAGGISPFMNPGDLMLIRDHVRIGLPGPLLVRQAPMPGSSEINIRERFGVRPSGCFFFRTQPEGCTPNLFYDVELGDLLQEAARREKIDLKAGLYAGNLGPTYETRAEIGVLHAAGADAVGMSTVPEVIAANQSGLRVAAVSCITNRVPVWGVETQVSHEEVIEQGRQAVERLKRLIARWAKDLRQRNAGC